MSIAPLLVNHELSKDFIMYVYASEFSITMVLTHKDNEGKGEHLIAFHSRTLKIYKVKYKFVEKQAFTIVKGLKKFRHFNACNKTTIYVAYLSVRE